MKTIMKHRLAVFCCCYRISISIILGFFFLINTQLSSVLYSFSTRTSSYSLSHYWIITVSANNLQKLLLLVNSLQDMSNWPQV